MLSSVNTEDKMVMYRVLPVWAFLMRAVSLPLNPLEPGSDRSVNIR
jgi:hypothetical protein